MNELSESPEIKNKYDSLKENLLRGLILPDDAIETLMGWDQSTPSRDAAPNNLNFLNDADVVEFVKQNEEFQKRYFSFKSLTEFHVAQKLALTNSAEAIDYFKIALEDAKKGHSDDGEWVAYIEGTIIYMEGKQIPEEIIERIDSPRNIEIMRNFNLGLQQRGRTSYSEDYSK